MTKEEQDALVALRYNLDKLSQLVVAQTQLLRTQASEIKRLQTERQALLDEVSEWRANGRMVEIAQSFSGDNLGRDMALSYLEDIIEEVKQCLRQLEQE
ncbi:MAG: hypothetical protein HXN24_04160 [Porphyromonas sp.]|nr:hypothetical protein [Porphyromonas sp.]